MYSIILVRNNIHLSQKLVIFLSGNKKPPGGGFLYAFYKFQNSSKRPLNS
ncbi:hypothetical protein SVI_1578 [Shewanella violacea DSS12]|uniref:Uncharacterized protein n=1 Tax=Shewanella violacea (strain JCM 10179 / CIP 106290 / LMG 19151 / DSS12) TaxID=637905 RepID=D4ZIQ0_SHEVD|nr:hypothetical protein SVI_1578 [Shewanella violacea DSS12]